MNKNIKSIIGIILVIISLLGIVLIVNRENKRTNIENITLLNEENSKIINTNNIYLSTFEVIIIVVLIFIITFIIGYLIYSYINIVLSKKYIAIGILAIIFISSIISFSTINIINNKVLKNSVITNDYEIKPTAEVIINSNNSLSYKKYTTYDSNKSTIIVSSGVIGEIKNSTINKLGDTKDKVLSKVYGINSGILALKDSILYIYNSTINTNSVGSNGIHSVLSNSIINIDMVNIDTSDSNSIGIAASIGGSINGTNVKVKTSSSNSPTIMNNNGTIKINNGIFESNGKYSPLIDTNSKVILNNCEGDANNSSVAYITSSGTLEINSSKLKVTGNKASYNSKEGGFIISNSSLNKTSEISLKDSEIEIKKQSKIYDDVEMFNISNTNTTINLTNTDFIYGSDKFININNNKKDKIKVILNLDNQQITGNINTSKNVNIEINLLKSTYKGNINSNDLASNVILNIDKSSKLILTDDIYVSVISNELEDYTNIESNGYNIYYKKELNSSLKDINFKDGGKLINY